MATDQWPHNTLLDTGARASELLAFDLSDLDRFTGELVIRRGKGGKGRVVFAEEKTRKALRAYLKPNVRGDAPGALFLSTRGGGRMHYDGLRTMLRRRGEQAGLDVSSLHAFRRTFAIDSLRAGVDLISLQRLLGHSDLSVIKRYLKQNTDDLRAVHAKTSPVDRSRV